MNNRPYFEVQTVTIKGNKKVEHSENIARVKLPFYCYYSLDGGKTKSLGIVDWVNGVVGFVLLDHTKQESWAPGAVGGRLILEDLIKAYNINTVKVKVIVFE